MKALMVGGSGATGVPFVQGLAARGYEVTVLHRGVHEPPELAPYRHIHADPHFVEPVAEALGHETFDLVVLAYGRLKPLAGYFAGRCGRLLALGGIPIYAGFSEPATLHPPGMALGAREDSLLAADAPSVDPAAGKFAAKMREAELAVLTHHARGDYVASLFRYPQIYGPRSIAMNDWSVIRRVRDGRDFILLPDAGLGIMSRCAAANAAHLILTALEHPAAAGEVFNCVDDDQFSLIQWVEMIRDALGAPLELIGLPPALNWAASSFLPQAGKASAHTMVDGAKARERLGHRDLVPAREALKEFVSWRMANPPTTLEEENWGDPFDYATEDKVRAVLRTAVDTLRPFERTPEVFHIYPHPKTPSLGADHRGR